MRQENRRVIFSLKYVHSWPDLKRFIVTTKMKEARGRGLKGPGAMLSKKKKASSRLTEGFSALIIGISSELARYLGEQGKVAVKPEGHIPPVGNGGVLKISGGWNTNCGGPNNSDYTKYVRDTLLRKRGD